MKNTLLIAATAFTAAGAVVLFGGVLRESSSAGMTALPAARSLAAFEPSYSTAQNATALVLRLQQRLRNRPDDSASFALLGLAYQQRARETGDPAYYPKSEAALRAALVLKPESAAALSGLASLALSRHRFQEGLALGRRARALAPDTARNYGAVGDALVELGRYREAFQAFDTMARLKPGLSAYARVSYARELLGRRSAAIAAMKLAAQSAGSAEAAAWSHVQLGKIHFNGGDYATAARLYRIALAYFPGYAYALDALGQAEAAQGRFAEAIVSERRAVEATPLPQYVALLGDLQRATGRKQAAARQYALIGAIRRLLEANGVRTDLEVALFQADHGVDLPGALRRARIAQRDRPSIDGNDVLAWTLYRNGRCAEALPYSKRALHLGTLDALKFFHRGMIERCLGNRLGSNFWLRRALDLSPRFSVLWAPVARRLAS
jgi:tetratricopeptide (TPR) repeat protein